MSRFIIKIDKYKDFYIVGTEKINAENSNDHWKSP